MSTRLQKRISKLEGELNPSGGAQPEFIHMEEADARALMEATEAEKRRILTRYGLDPGRVDLCRIYWPLFGLVYVPAPLRPGAKLLKFGRLVLEL